MVKDIKELDRLLKLLRKQGVTEFEFNGLSLKLGDFPKERVASDTATLDDEIKDDPWAEFPAGMLTPEQLTYYSAGGTPDQDPFKDKDKQ